MRCPDGIYIMHLHKLEIHLHMSNIGVVSCVGIAVMTVYSAKFRMAMVDLEDTFFNSDVS